MKLFLHVGTHKTGSTHLQIYLRRNAVALAEQGLLYPDLADWFGGPSSIAHHALVAAASQKKVRYDARREALKTALAAADQDRTMLISAEPAYRRTFPEVCPPEQLWEGRGRYVGRLKRMFAGQDTTVVICFRNRATFGESHYGSAVKSGYAKGFEDYLGDHAFMFDYDRQRDLFEKAFGELLVYSYEEAAEGGVAETFLRKIGFEAPTPDDRPPTRRSPDPRIFLWMARRNAASDGESDETRGERISFSTTKWCAAALAGEARTTLWSERTRPFLEGFGDGAAMDALAGRPLAALSDEEEARLDAAFAKWLPGHRETRRRA